MLTGAVGFSSKRSLIAKFAVTGPVPGSGARHRNQGLDVVSTAFSAAQPPRTPRITGSKKHSDEARGATLFAVRVHAIVGRTAIAEKTAHHSNLV